MIQKPKWAPPAWVFGPVWILLYSLLAISMALLFINGAPFVIILPFLLNIMFNLSYLATDNLKIGALSIVLTLLTAIWSAAVSRHFLRAVSFLQIPYILWLSFALVLQLSIKEQQSL